MTVESYRGLILKIIPFAAWLAAGAAGAPRAEAAQAPRGSVAFVVSGKDLTSAPIWLADRLGFFKSDGDDAKIVIMKSDLQVVSLVSGDADFAGSLSSVTKAAAIGLPVKIVLSFYNGSLFYLVTRPEITDIKMLRKKTIAVSRYGSATDFDARGTLKHFGMEKEIDVLQVGAGTNRLASLISGRVDGAILEISEKEQAEKAGMRALFSTGQFNKQPLGGLGSSADKIRSHRDALIKSLRPVYRALQVMKNDKATTKDFFEKDMKISGNRFESSYEAIMKIFVPEGELPVSDLAAVYEDARKAATNPPPVKLEDMVDWSLIRAARVSMK